MQGFFQPGEADDLSRRKAYQEALITHRESLFEYLLWQIGCLDLTAEELEIAEEIVGNLNRDGYLTASLEEIARVSGSSPERVEKILKEIQGLDPAGIAAQSVVEKELRKEGLRRQDLGREKFEQKVKEWKEKYGTIILEQLKKLGVLPDWSRTRYTMDSDYSKSVMEAFKHYYKKGWIYRGERVINWCVRCTTSISDLEVNYMPETAKLYFIKYGPFTLATTRPETKVGDTALAVHPNDRRYKKYIGKDLDIESIDNDLPVSQPARVKKIKIKVVADRAGDPEFGTGIIKVTPAHDITDFEIAERHNLTSITIIDEHGQMNENAGLRYRGMKTTEARGQIIKDLGAIGLIEKIEDYEHNIARCDRCDSVIEPLPSKQWFLKMKELAKLAIEAIENKETVIYPKRWEKVLKK